MKRLIGFILIAFIGVSCKKESSNPSTTTPTQTPIATPAAPNLVITVPADANGVLMASRIPFTFSNNYTTLKGSATAFFYTAPGNYTYVDAGVVKCNDSILTKQSSGSYYFSGTAKNGQPISGIDYAAGSVWSVAGTSSVPAFTFTNAAFPADAMLTSSTLINKSAPYTVTFNGANNSDSVVVMFGCDSVLLKRTIVTTVGTCNFTAAEVGSVKKKYSSNKGYINLISYKIQPNTVSGKKYYMIDSNTATYTVTIQ